MTSPAPNNTINLEWKVRGLKEIFESSRGTNKSQVIKSDFFGDGQWQLYFYANSGNSGTHISIFLAAEPTQEERNKAKDGQTNESARPILSKKAYDHPFSYKTPNWGWGELATRDTVYYNLPKVQGQDSFLIECQVTKHT